ncbi:hypothetical protein K461DRAFT_313430 [Myriangium duriaei CBS 260.36]|uniref:Ubiquitin-like protease family profile domain-containing protein n=1 Tax=Myriangium duriaei CBS 260.36 TaxID=1168546 RepID=A0A9P4MES6_9PEZI|nr:hypothetical protein K461DRAFT_313430 [Myriangium duriaei CBS 260.36]
MAIKRVSPRLACKHDHEKCTELTKLFQKLQRSGQSCNNQIDTLNQEFLCSACTSHPSAIQDIISSLWRLLDTTDTVASQNSESINENEQRRRKRRRPIRIRIGKRTFNSGDTHEPRWDEGSSNKQADSDSEDFRSTDSSADSDKDAHSNDVCDELEDSESMIGRLGDITRRMILGIPDVKLALSRLDGDGRVNSRAPREVVDTEQIYPQAYPLMNTEEQIDPHHVSEEPALKQDSKTDVKMQIATADNEVDADDNRPLIPLMPHPDVPLRDKSDSEHVMDYPDFATEKRLCSSPCSEEIDRTIRNSTSRRSLGLTASEDSMTNPDSDQVHSTLIDISKCDSLVPYEDNIDQTGEENLSDARTMLPLTDVDIGVPVSKCLVDRSNPQIRVIANTETLGQRSQQWQNDCTLWKEMGIEQDKIDNGSCVLLSPPPSIPSAIPCSQSLPRTADTPNPENPGWMWNDRELVYGDGVEWKDTQAQSLSPFSRSDAGSSTLGFCRSSTAPSEFVEQPNDTRKLHESMVQACSVAGPIDGVHTIHTMRTLDNNIDMLFAMDSMAPIYTESQADTDSSTIPFQSFFGNEAVTMTVNENCSPLQYYKSSPKAATKSVLDAGILYENSMLLSSRDVRVELEEFATNDPMPTIAEPSKREQSNPDSLITSPKLGHIEATEEPRKRIPGLFRSANFDAPLVDQVAASLQVLLKYVNHGHGLDVSERLSVFNSVQRRLSQSSIEKGQDHDGWTMEFWISYLAKAESGLKKNGLDRLMCILGFHQATTIQGFDFKSRFESEFPDLRPDEKKKLQQKLTTHNFRGEKLLRLVEIYGTGILLSPYIWDILKGTRSLLNRFIEDIECIDPGTRILLRLLEPQIEAIQCCGKADYEDFWTSLRLHFGAGVWQQLDAKFAPEKALQLPDYILTNAVRNLITHYENRLKTAATDGLHSIGDQDTGFEHNGAFFNLKDLNYLYNNKRFSNFLILAAMILAKPDQCIVGPTVEVQYRRRETKTSYFKNWMKSVDNDRKRRADSQGLYLCPVLYKNHFSLLEIDDSRKKISLYDSAKKNSSTNDPVLKRVTVEFIDTMSHGYTIERVPCPQQSDDSSCGPLVVRMAIQRMNGLEVGDWDDPVIPTRVRLDIVNLFDSCKDAAEICLPNNLIRGEASPEQVELSVQDKSHASSLYTKWDLRQMTGQNFNK